MPASRAQPRPRRRPLPVVRPAFHTGLGVLYQTDCLKLFAAIKAGAVDCVFADPPFNLGKIYGKVGAVNDDLTRQQYLDWSCAWLDEAVRVLAPGGAIFVYILPHWAFHFAAHLERRGLLFRHWIALSMKGTFPRGQKLYPAHYALLYFTKGAPRTFTRPRVPIPVCRHCGKDVKDYGGHRKHLSPLGLNLTDFWEDTAPARHAQFKARWHVNELKPMIPGRCIEMATAEGDLVLDPFGGGGSTFEAAEAAGRCWIGSEITDCAIIRDRFARRFGSRVRQGFPPERIRAAFADGNGAFALPHGRMTPRP
jgi:site-specific DNA-methyltransferase (adenine-specific)